MDNYEYLLQSCCLNILKVRHLSLMPNVKNTCECKSINAFQLKTQNEKSFVPPPPFKENAFLLSFGMAPLTSYTPESVVFELTNSFVTVVFHSDKEPLIVP